MGQTARELRGMWRKRYRHLLDSIFEECASQEITVGPDEAMDWMEECLGKLTREDEQSKLDETMSEQVSNLRFDVAAYRREAHHYAVDRFYKTYFPRKRGAPPLPTAYLDSILRLRFKGLNNVSIAEKLGQPKGRMKKQVETAEKRWRESSKSKCDFHTWSPRNLLTKLESSEHPDSNRSAKTRRHALENNQQISFQENIPDISFLTTSRNSSPKLASDASQ